MIAIESYSSDKDIGDVSFSPMLYLYLIFYTLEFLLNLLFNSKLTRSLDFSINFDVTSISIQDLRTSKVIGIRHESHELY